MTILVTMGEVAGIGPDICLALAGHPTPLVILGDKKLLAARAKMLGLTVTLRDYVFGETPVVAKQVLTVLHVPGLKAVQPGRLAVEHAAYVMALLTRATALCLDKTFSALVTAPVHKGILNDAGFAFTGHTEFLAKACDVDDVVMFFVTEAMRMGLVTTHLPLREVPDAITPHRLRTTIQILQAALVRDFGVENPRIGIAGLNPHAGESGHLGREELEVITPTLNQLRQAGMQLDGPMPADTLFTQAGMKGMDALLAMYHDQGLSILKYNGFGESVNITLGLPIIRTSVDHGTALDLAGKGVAHAGSLIRAVNQAAQMVVHRECKYA